MSKYFLVLDDYRSINDVFPGMGEGAVLVKNFEQFTYTIKWRGIPEVVSFDHDLAPQHYAPQRVWGSMEDSEVWHRNNISMTPTGFDCFKWLVGHCISLGSPMPHVEIHSANEYGVREMFRFKKSLEKFFSL